MRTGLLASVSRTTPPNVAVITPHATQIANGIPALTPFLAPMTQKAPCAQKQITSGASRVQRSGHNYVGQDVSVKVPSQSRCGECVRSKNKWLKHKEKDWIRPRGKVERVDFTTPIESATKMIVPFSSTPMSCSIGHRKNMAAAAAKDMLRYSYSPADLRRTIRPIGGRALHSTNQHDNSHGAIPSHHVIRHCPDPYLVGQRHPAGLVAFARIQCSV